MAAGTPLRRRHGSVTFGRVHSVIHVLSLVELLFLQTFHVNSWAVL